MEKDWDCIANTIDCLLLQFDLFDADFYLKQTLPIFDNSVKKSCCGVYDAIFTMNYLHYNL